MSHLTISLLKNFEVTLDQRPINNLGTDKVRALLAYLAVEVEQVHSRSALAELLWGEQTETAARHSLRQALLRLRSALGRTADRYLLVDADVQFNPASDYTLDVAEFAALVQATRLHTHRRVEMCSTCLARLRRAVELYRGDFLQGFFIKDSATFEEWALLQRERLHRQALEALDILARHHEERGEYAAAESYATRKIELDPWCEESCRQLMRVLVRDGRRRAALAQYEMCRRRLKDELDSKPEAATTALYERIRNGEYPGGDGRDGHSLGLPVPPGLLNGPVYLTSFVNREAELGRLDELLQDSRCRLITLVGPGGIGKTRLAVEAAVRAAPSFRAGARFVSLDSARRADVLLQSLGQALSLAPHAYTELKSEVFDYLCAREMLLVLDNFEQLVGSARLLVEILQAAPRVTLLVTSREPLDLQAECLVCVKGLSFPTAGCEPECLEDFSAVRLFAERARQVQPDFALNAETAPGVVRLCQLVDGAPLAIELAAALMGKWSIVHLASKVEYNIDLLVTTMRDIPERHRSLRAVFKQSWRLLAPKERRILERLATLPDGFTWETARAFADATAARLSTLLDKSFLVETAPGHYALPLWIKKYAGEKYKRKARPQEHAPAISERLDLALLPG